MPVFAEHEKTVQKKEPEKNAASPNITGIPDGVKTRFENLSGFSFDDVRVHYNSSKPAHLSALAYTQGNEVHIAPGQERHLNHELGHVVQQKQGIVPVSSYLSGVAVNDDLKLERQASEIGRINHADKSPLSGKQRAIIQGVFIGNDEAAAAFGENFTYKHTELIAKMNILFDKLLASDTPRKAWMETLNHATRMSLLHQMYKDGTPARMIEICRALQTLPVERYPDNTNDGECWKFLIDITTAQKIPRDLGMLGTLPEWVEKLKEIYQKADKHIVERDISAFYEAALEGKRHLSGIRSNIPKIADAAYVMKYLSEQIKVFIIGIYTNASEELGLTNFCLLAVGSLAREELFPYSDLDYSLLVSEVSETIGLVEQMINLKLSIMGEKALDPIGIGKPTDVAAEHVTEKKDVLLDAKMLSGNAELWDEYEDARSSEMAKPHQEAATGLIESETIKFSPTGKYLKGSVKDVKKGLLRLPTFIVRNLCYYFNITEETTLDKRVECLLSRKIINAFVADKIQYVVTFASELRIKCHQYYKDENEAFVLPEDAAKLRKPKDFYVLSAEESTKYRIAKSYNLELETLSQQFTAVRTQYKSLEEYLTGYEEIKEKSTPNETIFLNPASGYYARITDYTEVGEGLSVIELSDNITMKPIKESYMVYNGFLSSPIMRGDTPYKSFIASDNPFA